MFLKLKYNYLYDIFFDKINKLKITYSNVLEGNVYIYIKKKKIVLKYFMITLLFLTQQFNININYVISLDEKNRRRNIFFSSIKYTTNILKVIYNLYICKQIPLVDDLVSEYNHGTLHYYNFVELKKIKCKHLNLNFLKALSYLYENIYNLDSVNIYRLNYLTSKRIDYITTRELIAFYYPLKDWRLFFYLFDRDIMRNEYGIFLIFNLFKKIKDVNIQDILYSFLYDDFQIYINY
jgi:hypothetical protein